MHVGRREIRRPGLKRATGRFGLNGPDEDPIGHMDKPTIHFAKNKSLAYTETSTSSISNSAQGIGRKTIKGHDLHKKRMSELSP